MGRDGVVDPRILQHPLGVVRFEDRRLPAEELGRRILKTSKGKTTWENGTQGIGKGREEGREEAYQQALLAYVELKFPEQARAIGQLVEQITDPEALQQVLLKLFVARNGQEVQDIVLHAAQESRV
jgi:hypothetical protein